jgi:hypothetical protein
MPVLHLLPFHMSNGIILWGNSTNSKKEKKKSGLCKTKSLE